MAWPTLRDFANAVAPGTVIIFDVVEGKPVVDAIKDIATGQARVIVAAADAAIALDQMAEDGVKNAVGGDLAAAIEIIRMPQKLEMQLIPTTGKVVIHALDEQNVKDTLQAVGAIPLAAAINQAVELYKSRAINLPKEVRTLLRTSFPPDVLANARWVIDANFGSLPAAINASIMAFREQVVDNHAVTVGHIIVFAKDPGVANIIFWAHEIQHTVQYSRLGIEKFAADYIASFESLEKEAEEVAKTSHEKSQVILEFLQTPGGA